MRAWVSLLMLFLVAKNSGRGLWHSSASTSNKERQKARCRGSGARETGLVLQGRGGMLRVVRAREGACCTVSGDYEIDRGDVSQGALTIFLKNGAASAGLWSGRRVFSSRSILHSTSMIPDVQKFNSMRSEMPPALGGFSRLFLARCRSTR